MQGSLEGSRPLPTATSKPPLCKGRCPAGAELFEPGPLCRCATSPHTVGSHPLHKGATLYPHRVYFGLGGVKRREVKKREEPCSTPARFSFFTSRLLLWGSQGAGPLGRAAVRSRSDQSPSGALKHTSRPALRDGGARCAPPSALSEVTGTFFASFLGVQRGRTPGRMTL